MCQNFWYNCPKMLGLYDFARFDKGTYRPLLLGNEHGRKCLLSETRGGLHVEASTPYSTTPVPRTFVSFRPNNQFEGSAGSLDLWRSLPGGLYYSQYFDPHYRDTHSQKKKFADVFDESSRRLHFVESRRRCNKAVEDVAQDPRVPIK